MVSIIEMDETDESDPVAARVRRRLYASRFLLALICGLLSVLVVAGMVPALVGVLAFAGCLAVASVAPQQTRIIREDASSVTRAEANAQDIIDIIPDPVMLLGGTGLIAAVNREFKAVIGQARPATSALLRFRNPEIQVAIRDAVEGKELKSVEYVERGRFERWYDVRISRLPDHLFDDAVFLMHFRDKSEAHRIDRMRTDFIGNASHELRTPLASLKGFLETLAGPARNDAAARDRFIPIMQEQAERMERLIDDLLSLSRFETAMGRANFGPVDLSEVLAHVRGAMKPLAASHSINLDCSIAPEGGGAIAVHGSRDELIQLFDNLVENAIKYGRENGNVRVTVEPGTDTARSTVAVHVSDDGPGIPEAHIPRLTERFYRVDVESSREKRGTGLGLAIVKHILTRHDGRLQVTSKLGAGSVFTVTLPVVES